MKLRLALVLLFVISVDVCAQNSQALHMFLPGRKGALELSLPGFSMEKGGLRPDGKQFVISAKNPNGIYLTAFVELAPHSGTNQQVRDDWFGGTKKNSKFKMDDVKYAESSNVATAEYIVHQYQGIPLEQKNVHAYYGGDEIWAEVHMSKVKFGPADAKLFEEALAGVHMLTDYVLNAADEFIVGDNFYHGHDYQQAAKHYQKALDLEMEKPSLNLTLTRVLIDQLGMSYGISNEIVKSRTVLEYGISKDPAYPLFYYNIACGYGEQNDKANALLFLKKAFERKANAIKGEEMPNPLTDDSFRKFVSDPTFVKEVKAMQQ